MMRSVVIIAVIGFGVGLMYFFGLMSVSRKVASVYIGTSGGRGVRFASCSGSVRRRVRFRESRLYSFSMKAEITGGEVQAELLAPGGKWVVCLAPGQPEAAAELENGTWYTLVYRFHSASGSFEIDWK